MNIGMFCTIYFERSAQPAEVVKIPDDNTLVVREAFHKLNGDKHEFSSNKHGKLHTFTLRKNGTWVRKGASSRAGDLLGLETFSWTSGD